MGPRPGYVADWPHGTSNQFEPVHQWGSVCLAQALGGESHTLISLVGLTMFGPKQHPSPSIKRSFRPHPWRAPHCSETSLIGQWLSDLWALMSYGYILMSFGLRSSLISDSNKVVVLTQEVCYLLDRARHQGSEQTTRLNILPVACTRSEKGLARCRNASSLTPSRLITNDVLLPGRTNSSTVSLFSFATDSSHVKQN